MGKKLTSYRDDPYIDSPYQRILWGKKHLPVCHGGDDFYCDLDGYKPLIYRENKHGFRGDPFTSDTEMIFVGCSMTYGTGIPDEDLLWGNILAKKLKLKASSIAKPGASIYQLVSMIFQYISDYGAPKCIYALFPGFYRIRVPIDGNILSSNQGAEAHTYDNSVDGFPKHYYTTLHLENDDERVKFSKKPHLAEEVISLDLAAELNVNSLRMLELYCKTNGIQLAWTSWELGYANFLSSLPDELKFDYFFNANHQNLSSKKYLKNGPKTVYFKDEQSYADCRFAHEEIDCDCYQKCHQPERLKFEGENRKDYFDCGLDTYKGGFSAHPGAHTQLHYAELFISDEARAVKEVW